MFPEGSIKQIVQCTGKNCTQSKTRMLWHQPMKKVKEKFSMFQTAHPARLPAPLTAALYLISVWMPPGIILPMSSNVCRLSCCMICQIQTSLQPVHCLKPNTLFFFLFSKLAVSRYRTSHTDSRSLGLFLAEKKKNTTTWVRCLSCLVNVKKYVVYSCWINS